MKGGRSYVLSWVMAFVCVLGMVNWVEAQTLPEGLRFTGDFRIRIEQDWNSRKSDGSYRDDRTRLRYRARFGMSYRPLDWASFGLRLRTGYREKQQDPHLTLGDGFQEFSTIPISLEKLYFRARYKWLDTWIGKNAFPFEKQNELFWSDNVYPDGVYAAALFDFEKKWIQGLKLSGGHFIMTASQKTFDKDSYVQVAQLATIHWQKRWKIFPTFYFFHKMPNIPDGNETFRFNYSILHLGTHAMVWTKPKITLGLDLYQNVQDYSANPNIPHALKNEKQGLVASALWGQLEERGDFIVGLYYMHLQRYSAVDFIAQNDWARWDYSAFDSPDGRLTNLKGLEVVAAYRINKYMKLKMRYFKVEQLIPYGPALENGDRIRLDLDIGF